MSQVEIERALVIMQSTMELSQKNYLGGNTLKGI